MKKSTSIFLWILCAIYAVTTILPGAFPALQNPIYIFIYVVAWFVFALVHGAIRYGARGIAIFLVVCLVFSNCMENLSIITGFPFGHYYYTDHMGPKLFLVPVLIGLGYFGTGYLAWTLANVLLDTADRRTDALSVISPPVIAAFVMASWDACLDPTRSTIQQNWIWQKGGGYFGVALPNYLGRWFTVYVFFQIFAIHVSRNPALAHAGHDKAYWNQAAAFFLVIALGYPATYLGGINKAIADATGKV